jgi:hypothetical protein
VPSTRQGDVADPQDLRQDRAVEDAPEGCFQQFLVLAPELADRIVVGMGVGAEIAHGHVLVGKGFNAPAGEGAGGIAVEQQTEHHAGRILRAAGAAVVGPGGGQVEQAHRVHDEVDDVIRRHPVPQVGREQQRGGVVDGDELGGHARWFNRLPRPCNRSDSSPTGC